ncbi:LysR family transcriptional regulator [Paenibacillus sp. HN-1]|uniref:LysR family transcriptional regulator n=1 Tax=Paenibacillus TaxID=44249 RepID=UPI001CA9605B|nr:MULTISPECIES: LysR family transcriptional regulator [Paenibacillus]MBY9079073.1 LysR family transcriptional regulator [Paenibacillus sp. CGMCC 1.18879]MBY9086851.1 LysR family transcriptional regulator [Paenibacillus sinensis]
MNLHNLRIFTVVAEKMNITEAARELYITQPAVSKAIKSLESQLNLQLFWRDKRNGLMLSDTGKEILILARQMIMTEEKIRQIANRENNLVDCTVKVGALPMVSSHLMPSAMSLLKSRYDSVRIQLMEGSSNEIKTWVEERAVEIGIVLAPFDSFDWQLLYEDDMVAVLPQEHRLASSEEINMMENQEELIFCRSGYEGTLSNLLAGRYKELNSPLIVQTAETLVNMVQHRLGIGIISRISQSALRHDLIVKPVFPAIRQQIGIIAHSFEELTPAAKAVHEILTGLGENMNSVKRFG